MAITIESTRFGRVDIDPDTVIEFPEGLIGLGGSRYALLSTQAGSPLSWLHCIDDPALSLPVAQPHRFFADFAVVLTDDDAATTGLGSGAAPDVYLTVVAASDLADFTANQKAPILVRDGRGHQVINQAPGCALRAPLFAEALARREPTPAAA
jgi:flagellar assembly factor FliW